MDETWRGLVVNGLVNRFDEFKTGSTLGNLVDQALCD